MSTLSCRDDLPDGGSNHLSECVKALKEKKPDILVECLLPDFAGNVDHVKKLAE